MPRLTVPAAAERAGMSASTWGHIERGYKPGLHGKPPTPFSASAQILAHAAFALGIEPGDLKSADRNDAAQILEEMIIARQQEETEVVTEDLGGGERITYMVPKDASPADRARLRRMAEKLVQDLADEYFSDGSGHGHGH
ncbi:hypothetical protein HerbRD11066_66950 [Herbidospora sp. RD11066]